MRPLDPELPTRRAPGARLAAAGILALALAARAAAALPPGAGAAAGPPVAGAVEDDWPRALAEARARGVPIVVDLWAPW